MLRLIRIIGILVFALMVAFSAASLKKMYENGKLMERYNNDRRANITLLAVSTLALGVLGFFELTRHRRIAARKGYGRSRYTDKKKADVIPESVDPTNIYAAPRTADAWNGRKTRTPRSHNQPRETGDIWFGLLRICCMALPLFYVALLALHLIGAGGGSDSRWVLSVAWTFMALFSALAAFGIHGKKAWGATAGYVLAICNLVIFPWGTAFGLFLLIGLVGSSECFAEIAREKRTAGRKKMRKAQALI
jgi:hypothetical protein